MSESVERLYPNEKMKNVREREKVSESNQYLQVIAKLQTHTHSHTNSRMVYKMGCTSKNAAAAAVEATTSFSRTISMMTSNNAVIHVSLSLSS